MFGASSSSRNLARTAALTAVLASAVIAPGVAHADEPLPPEVDTNPTTLPPSSARTNLLIGGAATTLAWYGIAVASSYGWNDADHASSLRIPFAGPFIGLAHTGCTDAEPNCDTMTLVLRTTISVLSAVGQIGGVAAMLEGAFLKTATPGQERPAVRLRRASADVPSALSFSLAPTPPVSGARDTALSGLSVQVLGTF